MLKQDIGMWIIGVDGGGTKCEAGLFSPDGQLIASALAGPANLYTNFVGAMETIEDVCGQLFGVFEGKFQRPLSKRDCFLSLGCAGGGIDAVKERFASWPHEYAGAALTTDVHVACLAANNSQACALFVIGTGSCLAVLNKANNDCELTLNQYGGHGFLLGDIASGAWLGKEAISWYLQCLESPHKDIALRRALASILGEQTSPIIEHYGQAMARDFGALVPVLLDVKSSSCMVKKWLDQGTKYIAGLLSHHSDLSIPIYLSGGLASVYKPLLSERLGVQINIPTDTAILGAYLHAQALLIKRVQKASVEVRQTQP